MKYIVYDMIGPEIVDFDTLESAISCIEDKLSTDNGLMEDDLVLYEVNREIPFTVKTEKIKVILVKSKK